MKKYLQTKPGSLEEAVLISRGLIEQTEYTISMKDASFFKGNDIKKAMMQSKRDGNTDKALDDLDMVGGDDEEGITFTARSPSEAVRNAEKAILDKKLKAGIIKKLGILMTDESRLVASSAEKDSKKYKTVYKNISYSRFFN